MTLALCVQDLAITARHGGPCLVRDVGFALADRQVLGIVGESGSGKSLTCLALAGLLDRSLVARGTLTVGGVRYDLSSAARLRALRGVTLGMIFQDPRASLNPVRTIGAHFDQVLRRHAPNTGTGRRCRMLELLDAVRVPAGTQRLGQYPHQLSGGLCQRISIALALAAHPRVLIADEPTTALDTTVQAQILDLLDGLRAEHGMAVILISHDLAVISELADAVAVMQDGRIVESADLPALFDAPQSPYTRRLVGLARNRQTIAEAAEIGHMAADG